MGAGEQENEFSIEMNIGETATSSSQSPFKRRQRRWSSPRDSLNKRERVGKPGSRRHQRFMNQVFLLEQFEYEVEDNIMEFTDSPLSLLFKENNQKLWAPFISITEEEQEQLLNCLCGMEEQLRRKDKKGVQTPNVSGSQSFKRIDKKIRRLLRKHYDNEFLCSMDQDLLEYVTLADINQRTYCLNDSFQRLLCHGVCQYYSLHSWSKDSKGRRILVVRKPQDKAICAPTETLRQYLETLRL
jgi:hypothetical protein